MIPIVRTKRGMLEHELCHPSCQSMSMTTCHRHKDPRSRSGERGGILTCLRGWDEGDQSKGRGWCRAEGTSVKEPEETGGGGTRGWRGHSMARTGWRGYFEIMAVCPD